jgi:hypothetical protein
MGENREMYKIYVYRQENGKHYKQNIELQKIDCQTHNIVSILNSVFWNKFLAKINVVSWAAMPCSSEES